MDRKSCRGVAKVARLPEALAKAVSLSNQYAGSVSPGCMQASKLTRCVVIRRPARRRIRNWRQHPLPHQWWHTGLLRRPRPRRRPTDYSTGGLTFLPCRPTAILAIPSWDWYCTPTRRLSTTDFTVRTATCSSILKNTDTILAITFGIGRLSGTSVVGRFTFTGDSRLSAAGYSGADGSLI